jgi:hypothetical protein
VIGALVSPFMVYIVLQMDSILFMLRLGAVACTITAAFIVLVTLMSTEKFSYDSRAEKEEKAADRTKGLKIMKKFAFASAVLFALIGFLPNSKVLAAMIIVPALTSDQVVEPLTREAGELYALAKSALARSLEAEGTQPQATAPEPEVSGPEGEEEKVE